MALFRSSKPAKGSGNGPQIGDLTDAERAWLAEHLATMASAGADVADIDSIGAVFDAQLRTWAAQPEGRRADPNQMINAIGIAFGAHIGQRTGLQWVLATDQYGSELALHGQPGNLVMYPTNMIAKRWVGLEYGCMRPLADATVQAVVLAQHSAE